MHARRAPTRARGALGLGCALLLLAAGASCSRETSRGAAKRPHILLVTMDTTRRDHCSVYGYERETTPTLRRLAEAGVRFDRAYAPTATTGPTHASLFSSLDPLAHGVVKNGLTLPAGTRTLAETLREHGYTTAAVVGSFVLDSRFGYDQGFQHYDDRFRIDRGSLHVREYAGHELEKGFDRRANVTTRRARKTLERLREDAPESPIFLFVHYFDPHEPYTPPPRFAKRFRPRGKAEESPLEEAIRRYDAEIAYTDEEIGLLLATLDKLGIARDTLVIVTGDHGEGLLQHDHMGHGAQIYEEAVRVPLVMRWPGAIAPNRRIAEPISLVDLAPTILDLAGLHSASEAFAGRSVARAVTDGAVLDALHPILLFRRHYAGQEARPGQVAAKGRKYGVIRGDWKYIEGPEEHTRELFDLREDPQELENVLAQQPEVAARLQSRIDAWRATATPSNAADALPEEDRRKLEALGYVE